MRRVPLPCRRLVWCLLLCCLPGCGEDPDNGEVQDGQSVQGCKSGSAAACDDGNDCTVDSCAKDGGCGHEPKSGSCQTGQPCTLGACVATTCANTGPATATTVVEDLLPWSVRRRPGGGLIAVGGLDTGLQWKLRVVALDLEGETIDAESRTVDALVRHCDFAPDGGIRCAGPGGPASVPLDKQHPQIGAWSADGEPLWQATLSNWPSDEHGCRRFAVAPDGGVFCGLDHPPKGPHQPLARLDHKGGVAWTHAIEEIALDQPPPLAPLDGGGVAMVGVPPDDWSAGVFKAIRVLSLGPKGDVMDADDVAVPQAAKAVSFLAMDRTTHGAVVVAVSDQVACAAGSCGDCSATCDKLHTWIAALTPTGELAWRTQVPTADGRSWHDWLHVAAMPGGGASLLGRPMAKSGSSWSLTDCANQLARVDGQGKLVTPLTPLTHCMDPATLMSSDAEGVAALGSWVFSDARKTSQRATLVRTTAWGHADCKSAGLCATLTPADCDDGDACTVDDCQPPTGCTHVAAPTSGACAGE